MRKHDPGCRIEHCPDIRQIRRFNARKKARFKRDAVHGERLCKLYEVLERHTSLGSLLLRINFTEKAMETVAVDTDLHDV